MGPEGQVSTTSNERTDFAKIAGKQRVTLASAVVAVAVAMAVLLAYLLLAGIAGKARQAGAVAFLVLGLGHLRNSESTLVAALRRVHFILTAVAVEALIALALVLTNTFTMVRTVGGARNWRKWAGEGRRDWMSARDPRK